MKDKISNLTCKGIWEFVRGNVRDCVDNSTQKHTKHFTWGSLVDSVENHIGIILQNNLNEYEFEK